MLTTLIVATLATFSTSQYTITKLAPLTGYQSFTPLWLNQSGTIVGVNAAISGDTQSSLWRDGVHEPLPELSGEITIKALNNKDVVAINLWSTTGNKALLYTDGQYSSLPPIQKKAPDIVGLNDEGVTLVTAGAAGLIWSEKQYTAIDKTGQTFPSAINNAGLVCGVTRQFDPAKLLGFTWIEGKKMKPMGESSGIGSGLNVLRLNDVDQVLVEFGGKSYLWQAGRYRLLCAAPNQAWAMNNRGDVIGHTAGVGPFIIRDERLVPLASILANGLGWQLQNVAAINDSGWIIGSGSLSGQRQGFVLKPAP